MKYYINYLKNNIGRKHILVGSGIFVVLGGLGTLGYLVKNGYISYFTDDEKKENTFDKYIENYKENEEISVIED